MKITADLFNAYLDCPTKSWLRGRGETSSGNLYSHWAASQEQVYRRKAIKHLLGVIPPFDHGIAPKKVLKCRPPKRGIGLDVTGRRALREDCHFVSPNDAS